VRRLIEEEAREDPHQVEIREIDQGEYVEYDAGTINGFAKDVHERGLRSLAAGREKTGTRD